MQETLSAVGVRDDSPRSNAPRVTARLRVPRVSRALMRSAGVIASLDGLAAVLALLVILIDISRDTTASIDGFLSARITVKNVLLLIGLSATWPLIFHTFRLYDAQRRSYREEALRVFGAVTTGSICALVFPLFSVSGSITVGDVGHFWLVSLGLCLALHTATRAVQSINRRHSLRTIIVGTGRLAQQVQRRLANTQEHEYDIVGFVDEPFDTDPSDASDLAVIGTVRELEAILMRQVVDVVVIALPVKSKYEQIQSVIAICERAGVQAKYGVDLFHSTVASPRFDRHEAGSFMSMEVTPDGYRIAFKRVVDIVGAIVGLVVLSPVFLLVAAAIKLTSPGPVFYVQNRCGYNKRPLPMFKFRSMRADADTLQSRLEERNEASGPVFKIRNDPRVTPLGRVLRKTSIDELPQLVNVLWGDMSLVGPRPLPWRDVDRIVRPADMRRFSMRPGLTCLWQVEGRSTLGFDRWVELDLEYIDKWSLALDMWILLRTIPAVITGKGAT
jgi:exopolysaccharide biosynthesis polyprenyl glycosylphosphotransferase